MHTQHVSILMKLIRIYKNNKYKTMVKIISFEIRQTWSQFLVPALTNCDLEYMF